MSDPLYFGICLTFISLALPEFLFFSLKYRFNQLSSLIIIIVNVIVKDISLWGNRRSLTIYSAELGFFRDTQETYNKEYYIVFGETFIKDKEVHLLLLSGICRCKVLFFYALLQQLKKKMMFVKLLFFIILPMLSSSDFRYKYKLKVM